MTFDETPPPSKTSPLVDDDLDTKEAIKVTEKKNLENDIMDETLEIDEIVNIKESRNHPLENVIGNLNQRTLRSQAQNQSNFFCFISTIEPKNVNEVLRDESRIVAMQEELNQFVANDVWELVPQPRNMKIIGTKWVFRNKLDENGVVSRNKARLVAQGYNQQEGIDNVETYAPVARLDSIRILLAYACSLDFKLFQMDIKSAFLNGFINEEVMAAPVISISSDSSEESMGSHAPRNILFGTSPATIPVIPEVSIVPVDPLVAPEVGAVFVTSPAGVLDLVNYSSSASDLSEDSLPPTQELPLVPPFLCFDDSEVDSESEPAEQRPERHESLVVHDVMVLRWRDRVASRPSSPSGSSSHDIFSPSFEFLIAPLLTTRKRVGPLSAHRLAWRRVSHRSSDHHSSPDFTSVSSSFGSSLDSSSDSSSLGSPSDSLSDTSLVHSLGFDASGQTHSGPSTRVASSRLDYLSVMTLHYSEAFRCWRSAPLSTPYPLTTSESSPDSSFERSLDSSSLCPGPSCKRCRFPTTSVPSSTLV
ncbi:retrovirus-related pol polyprotein from transposon TNT 1-94 [Tanacetum coccineum]|uniref:Retrovirus-related pol polyprotein from transposon TNT 1-94 n=1 Tax=Tanacetum coccineum TaxID=301880 RepID=A0ABQ4WFA1_9ASTR